MAVVPNRAYNDPNIGAAFANLAGLFAPPDARDIAAYAAAKAEKEKAARLSDLYSFASAPGADRSALDNRAAAAGVYTPSNSFYAVDEDNRTKRYGYDQALTGTKYTADRSLYGDMYDTDVDARVAAVNNMRDNQRAIAGFGMAPLDQGEIRPGLTPDLAALFGMPEIAAAEGAPKPMTEAEFNAAILGTLPREQQIAAAMGTTPVEQVVGPDGQPLVVWRPDAVGKPAYVQQGSEAKPTNAIAQYADGKRVPAVQMADGKWRDPQTGAELAPGFTVYDVPKAVGTGAEVGFGTSGMTTSVKGDTQNKIMAIDAAISTAATLDALLAKNPASLGAAGWSRRTLQDLAQSSDELAVALGGQIGDTIKRARAAGVEEGVINEYFNSDLVGIQMMQNLLVWQYAAAMSGDRVSNEQLERAREVLNMNGLLSNTAGARAALAAMTGQLGETRKGYAAALSEGIPVETPAPAGVTSEPDGTMKIETPQGPVIIRKKPGG